MSLSIKPRAKVNGLRPEMIIAIMVANEVFSENGYDLTITEGTGGKHGRGSKHYIGNGVDLRTRNIKLQIEKDSIADDIRARLGEQYDVVLESDHLHIEFDPKD